MVEPGFAPGFLTVWHVFLTTVLCSNPQGHIFESRERTFDDIELWKVKADNITSEEASLLLEGSRVCGGLLGLGCGGPLDLLWGEMSSAPIDPPPPQFLFFHHQAATEPLRINILTFLWLFPCTSSRIPVGTCQLLPSHGTVRAVSVGVSSGWRTKCVMCGGLCFCF